MSSPIIFPSLSCFPTMDGSESLENDTLSDKAQSGYVATRPRFTRVRRTWKVNFRTITAADKLALETFAAVTTARGANSFFFPNMVLNGGFETPATVSGQIAAGWVEVSPQDIGGTNPIDAEVIVETSTVDSGGSALQCGFVAGHDFPADYGSGASAGTAVGIPVIAGESYTLSGDMLSSNPTTGGSWNPILAAWFTDSAGTATTLGTNSISHSYLEWPVVSGNGSWQAGSWTLTAPAGATQLFLVVGVLMNTGSTAQTTTSAWNAYFDNLACALTTPLTTFGRMAGSANLGVPVRFTSLPEFSDMGWVGNQKRFGAAMALTEV